MIQPFNLVEHRNRHFGEDCMILANGPSLNPALARVMELERIPVSVGINSSWKAWTSDYHVILDLEGMHQGPIYSHPRLMYLNGLHYRGARVKYEMNPKSLYDWGIKDGCFPHMTNVTTTLAAIQLGVYLGACTLYIMGLDLNLAGHHDGTVNTPNLPRQIEALKSIAAWLDDIGVNVFLTNKRSVHPLAGIWPEGAPSEKEGVPR